MGTFRRHVGGHEFCSPPTLSFNWPLTEEPSKAAGFSVTWTTEPTRFVGY